jgi:hypothetical protein
VIKCAAFREDVAKLGYEPISRTLIGMTQDENEKYFQAYRRAYAAIRHAQGVKRSTTSLLPIALAHATPVFARLYHTARGRFKTRDGVLE